MGAAEFEGFLYNNLSYQPFKNQIINIKDKKVDYIISDYFSHHFGMIIRETMIYLSYIQNKRPEVLNYD